MLKNCSLVPVVFSRSILCVALTFAMSNAQLHANQIDETQVGAWYMFFFGKDFSSSRFGFQGDIQYRTWNGGSDLEQLLVRGGVTYRPEGLAGKYTFGLANITSGQFGSSKKTLAENRAYQEALIPQNVGRRTFLKHRLRLEQRWVNGQDFRTRVRYALFANIPLNRPNLSNSAWYLALYNEIFINGERSIGSGRNVDFFDRNRFYAALGYKFSDAGQFQAGYLQQRTDAVSKGQLQVSVHYTF